MGRICIKHLLIPKHVSYLQQGQKTIKLTLSESKSDYSLSWKHSEAQRGGLAFKGVSDPRKDEEKQERAQIDIKLTWTKTTEEQTIC